MKKTIITLVLVLTALVIRAQTMIHKSSDSTYIKIHGSLYNDFMSFVKHAKSHDINLSKLTELKIITRDDTEEYFGYYDNKLPYVIGIYIAENIPEYIPSFRKATLYHELGHHLLEENCMHTKEGPYILYPGKHMNVEIVIRHWAMLEENYMKYLKDNINGNSK